MRYPRNGLDEAAYVCGDFELTGLDKHNDVIVEIALLFCDSSGKILGEYETLVNPLRDTGKVNIHGITNEMVSGKPSFNEIAKGLAQLLYNKIYVGNYVDKDMAILERQLADCSIAFQCGKPIDISAIASDTNFVDRYEEKIMRAYDRQKIAHRAMPDARFVADILPCILDYSFDNHFDLTKFHPAHCYTEKNMARSITPRHI